jgi:hypothetical protein
MAATAARILTQPPDLDRIPPSLCDLVAASLEKRPHDRPAARELMHELTKSARPATTGGGRRRARVDATGSGRLAVGAARPPPPLVRGGALHRRAGRSRLAAVILTGAVLTLAVVIGALSAGGMIPWQAAAQNVKGSTPGPAATPQTAENVKNPDGALPGFADQYQVVNRLTGECLAVALSPPPAFSATAAAEKCSGAPRQTWRFHADHTVRSAGGVCVASGPRAADGTIPIKMMQCDGSAPTVWFIFGGQPGTKADVPGLGKRHLFNREADQCLGIVSGKGVQIMQCKDGAPEEWDFKAV